MRTRRTVRSPGVIGLPGRVVMPLHHDSRVLPPDPTSSQIGGETGNYDPFLAIWGPMQVGGTVEGPLVTCPGAGALPYPELTDPRSSSVTGCPRREGEA